MFAASEEFYDLIYSTFKDYAAEATQIASVLRRANPRCRTVLDVACGTGEHARLLAADGFVVDGLDLGRISRLLFDYEITNGTGTRRASEVHELGLFTTTELLETFRNTGLDADYDPKGLTDRGLFVARVAA